VGQIGCSIGIVVAVAGEAIILQGQLGMARSAFMAGEALRLVYQGVREVTVEALQGIVLGDRMFPQ